MDYKFNFGDFDFVPNDEMKKIIREATESFASAALASAAMALLSQVVINGILAPRTTKITVDGNIPAQLLTIGEKGSPKAVYISTKKHRINLVPAAVFGAAALIARLYLNKDSGDTHVV